MSFKSIAQILILSLMTVILCSLGCRRFWMSFILFGVDWHLFGSIAALGLSLLYLSECSNPQSLLISFDTISTWHSTIS